MSKSKEVDQNELERICFNCNNFLPLVMGNASESGICLNDNAFEPYIDELIEKENFDCCQDLIKKKKFSGEKSACSDFSDMEIIEIDDESEIGKRIKSFVSEDKIDTKSLQNDLLEFQLNKIDFKNIPIEKYVGKLKSSNPEERDYAISNLSALISFDNEQAFQELFNFFRNQPPPCKLEDVHFKIKLLNKIWRSDRKEIFLDILINEFDNTPSNNTTRQWISEILKYLSCFPYEHIKQPLERILDDKKISYRLKEKIKNILYLKSV